MQLDQIILDFKDDRKCFKKTSINVSVNEKRLNNMINSIGNDCFMFKMLNKSEQIDFLLYFAEKSMVGSDMINLQIVEREK